MGFEASNFTRVTLQPPVQICDSNHTHLLMNFKQSWLLANDCPWRLKESFTPRNGGTIWPENGFLSPFVQERREMVPSTCYCHAQKQPSYIQPSAETWAIPPPPVQPSLLAQNLRPKVIAGRDITSGNLYR